MAHVEITINNINTTQIEILIAQLSELSFDGFEELDNCLKAYIKEENYSANLLKVLFDTNNLTYSNSIINEINWNENWESSFHPISVLHFNQESIFAFIRANFHQPNPNATFDLLITPKMSFGTGHHATTFQMIEQMSLIDFANKSVIDFGTGTGLLSILAEKMGANSKWSHAAQDQGKRAISRTNSRCARAITKCCAFLSHFFQKTSVVLLDFLQSRKTLPISLAIIQHNLP
jgi:ribosomal protein L11 methyltransferase